MHKRAKHLGDELPWLQCQVVDPLPGKRGEKVPQHSVRPNGDRAIWSLRELGSSDYSSHGDYPVSLMDW